MEKRLKNYIKYVTEYVEKYKVSDSSDKEDFLKDLLIQISFFQHERLIHLIVTVAFAFFTIISIVACLFTTSMPLLILTLLFVVLLIPYIRHYYILENGVQKLYTLYDEICQLTL